MNQDEFLDAAFWHKRVCLACDSAFEEDEVKVRDDCPECGEPSLVDSHLLAGWIAVMQAEEV